MYCAAMYAVLTYHLRAYGFTPDCKSGKVK